LNLKTATDALFWFVFCETRGARARAPPQHLIPLTSWWMIVWDYSSLLGPWVNGPFFFFCLRWVLSQASKQRKERKDEQLRPAVRGVYQSARLQVGALFGQVFKNGVYHEGMVTNQNVVLFL